MLTCHIGSDKLVFLDPIPPLQGLSDYPKLQFKRRDFCTRKFDNCLDLTSSLSKLKLPRMLQIHSSFMRSPQLRDALAFISKVKSLFLYSNADKLSRDQGLAISELAQGKSGNRSRTNTLHKMMGAQWTSVNHVILSPLWTIPKPLTVTNHSPG